MKFEKISVNHSVWMVEKYLISHEIFYAQTYVGCLLYCAVWQGIYCKES